METLLRFAKESKEARFRTENKSGDQNSLSAQNRVAFVAGEYVTREYCTAKRNLEITSGVAII